MGGLNSAFGGQGLSLFYYIEASVAEIGLYKDLECIT